MRLNNVVKKIFAAGLAVSLMMANAGVSFAFTYRPISGTTTTFTKTLDLGSNANIPAVEFEYTIAPGTEKIAAADNTFEVLPGVGTPTITKATFAAGPLADGATTAEQTVTVSFTNVNFTEPGVYRYIITETKNQQYGFIEYDSKENRYLDVCIVDDGNGALEVGNYVLHETAVAPNSKGTATDAKSTGYTNKYLNQDLTISKTVSGNQASRDKYFKFDVTVENLTAGNICSVDTSHADGTVGSNAATLDAYEGETNATSITADASGKATATFYLQHGQSIVIKGLAKGASYTVVETPEEYTCDAANNTISGEIADAAATAAFTNTKKGTVPTGVILDSAPFILIIVLAAAALAFTAARKKNR